jgi:16S rRNA (cytidine1402-2'-O)-methyltransferase
VAISSGTLYVCATPLGNLEDITLRTLRILRETPFIAAENREKTRALLTHFGISSTLVSYREENRKAQAAYLVGLLKEGRCVALVSEAGTPAVSDPGDYLVRQCRAHGIPVVPVPGPSALTAALSASGIHAPRFFFAGFLPAGGGKRRKAIAELEDLPCPIILYEGPHRLVRTLSDLLSALGNRRIFIAREMTKKFEEYRLETLKEALARYAAAEPRGELVLIVDKTERGREEPPEEAPPEEEIALRLQSLVEGGLTRRDAAKCLSKELGISSRKIYSLASGLESEKPEKKPEPGEQLQEEEAL